MSSILLTSGDVKNYRPLGAAGIPAYTVAPQLRQTIRRTLGPEAADLLAIPQINETGTRLDWYAPMRGAVVPWSAASEVERAAARERLAWLRERLASAAAQPGGGDAQMFLRQLPNVGSVPGDDNVFLVDGRPVLTFWGFGAAAGSAPVAAVPIIAAAPAPTPAAPVSPPAAGATGGGRRVLWALPLLALLALPFLWPEKACMPVVGGPAEAERVVVMLDTSRSMSAPIDAMAEAQPLLARMTHGDTEALVQFENLLARYAGKPTRLDTAKASIGTLIGELPPEVDVGLVTFGRCGSVKDYGMHTAADRDALRETVEDIRWNSGTPLAEGLARSAALVDGTTEPAVIVIISDGAESCGGDPCGVARHVHAEKPLLRVNVIDVTGEGAASCLATETGGAVIDATAGEGFDDLVTRAARLSTCS